ncbi:MAG TPA: thioredoxin domain-containing protein [Pyrinomonadaceae bacterium]|jgi:protein-disulfide isomerase|nr:thioredoxin domain-containing protein [Pyrinomonadaceae bacterium]
MRKLLYAIFISCALAGSAAAQTVPVLPGRTQTPAKAEDCGCEGKPLPEVLATAGGVKITKQDISSDAQKRIDELRRQVVEVRKRELELQINSRLLEAEAKKRGLTTNALLQAEVFAKTSEPTETDARAFFDANQDRVAGSTFDAVKGSIIEYLRSERQSEQAQRFAEALRATGQVKKNVEAATPPATDADRARVFATVNGQSITSADIEDSLRPLVYAVQEQVYDLIKRDVDLKVNDMLLNQESQKRGVTARALLETEVYSKLAAVTDADAQKFFDENKERINGDFARTKPQIFEYLQEQNTRRATSEFAERLRAAAQVQTFLPPPEPPVYKIATDDQPSKGGEKAPVTLVVFTDFECGTCGPRHAAFERILSEYGDRVRLVVRDFPLFQHNNAQKAAEAAEAAREQGKYWDFIAILFQNPSALQPDKLKEYATRAGLDRAKFDAALDSGKFADKVQRDMLDGQKLGVSGTPAVFANGVPVKDSSYEGVKAAVEAALKAGAR